MAEKEQIPTEKLSKTLLIELTRNAVVMVHEQNPNALGVIIHGSRVNEGVDGKKQPRIDSDVDTIIIRNNRDEKALANLADEIWKRIGPSFGVLIDTGPWGPMEWEAVQKANVSAGSRENFQNEWQHLTDSRIVIGATPEIEKAVTKALQPL